MTQPNDGGPAFPCGPSGMSISYDDGRTEHQYPGSPGMSLRDWFAGQASEQDTTINLALSQRIRDWFQGSKANLGYRELDAISSEIDATIAATQEPLTGSAAAWKRWSDFEADANKNDPGLHQAMNLCSFAEWCADTELGLTSEPFEGVPRLVITSAAYS